MLSVILFFVFLFSGYFLDFYLAVLGLQFASTGSGYMLSTIFNPKSSQVAAVVFAFINAVMAGG